ncbi:MAG TPA: FAD-dependent oxidoreductase [bacterium (Candidatus Stahlbacteria)]|nr:FAD-dependent oxidoreductase [Candidatus Stahlbacteria bacterium]
METEVLVIGGGPAGLSAAITAKELGRDVLLVDENTKIGGQLVKQTHKFFGSKEHYCGVRGIDIAAILFDKAQNEGIQILLEASAIGIYEDNSEGSHTGRMTCRKVGIVKSEGSHTGRMTYGDDKLLEVNVKGIVVAAGASENMLAFPNNDLPGVYGAGAVQTLMNVYGVSPGENVLMVGSGNIGLIVSYQLMQAGIQVVGIVEALPTIGGYLVHASKVRRLGIPIYTSHTIKEAIGKNEVEGAVIVELDENWNSISGTEKFISCDVICLAVGLSPSTELLWQAGCKMKYVPELGGHVPIHNERMETNIKGIYVAGDASGIEEAVTAILEGRIAGAACAAKIEPAPEAEEIIHNTLRELEEFREGPFSQKIKEGKRKLCQLI